MATITCPHDKLFIAAMADIRVAQDFFKHYLPKAALDLIDLSTLKPYPNSYINQSLQLSGSDVLYEAIIDGQIGYIYILCEHQSSVAALMPFRLWQYMIGIWT